MIFLLNKGVGCERNDLVFTTSEIAPIQAHTPRSFEADAHAAASGFPLARVEQTACGRGTGGTASADAKTVLRDGQAVRRYGFLRRAASHSLVRFSAASISARDIVFDSCSSAPRLRHLSWRSSDV